MQDLNTTKPEAIAHLSNTLAEHKHYSASPALLKACEAPEIHMLDVLRAAIVFTLRYQREVAADLALISHASAYTDRFSASTPEEAAAAQTEYEALRTAAIALESVIPPAILAELPHP